MSQTFTTGSSGPSPEPDGPRHDPDGHTESGPAGLIHPVARLVASYIAELAPSNELTIKIRGDGIDVSMGPDKPTTDAQAARDHDEVIDLIDADARVAARVRDQPPTP